MTFLKKHPQHLPTFQAQKSRKLAGKIKAKALTSPFTVKDVYGKHWHGLKDRQEVEAACNILIDEN